MADDKKNAKKKLTTAKSKFTRMYNHIHQLIEKPGNAEAIVETFPDVEFAYRDLEVKHEAYINLLDSDEENEKAIIDHEDEYIATRYVEYSDARLMGKKISSDLEKETKQRMFDEKVVAPRVSIKVRPLEAPVFKGNIREYPSFKREYQRHMTETFGDDPFALKSCLAGDALKLVQGVDSDHNEMFRRLDAKYGRPEKLADIVLNDLKCLKRINDGDNQKFILMVEVIEKSWLDLKQMNMESEMNNSTMVSQIEKLLPSIQKREWALRKHKRSNTEFSERFKEFLDFLLEEKEAMEYMEDALRQSGGKNQVNYFYEKVAEEEEPPEGCVINMLKQQMQENREALNKVVQGLAQVTQAMTTSDKEKRSFTNYDRSQKCWYCATDDHPIESCATFRTLDNKVKISSIRAHGACFNCLKVGHISRNCLDRKPCEITDERNQKCGRFHHPVLHTTHRGISNNVLSHNMNSEIDKRVEVFLMISDVTCRGASVTTLWDPGANMSLITHREANRLGLKGNRVCLNITKVGNVTETLRSKRYIIPLTDKSGKIWKIPVYGMDEVTADSQYMNISKIVELFEGISEEDIRRPRGRVELLIGTDCCQLLPTKIQEIGNLQLLKNQFGYCLRGSHPTIGKTVETSEVKVHFFSGTQVHTEDARMEVTSDVKEQLESIFESSNLEKCHNSNLCGSCRCGGYEAKIHFTSVNQQKPKIGRKVADSLEQQLSSFFEIENIGTECYPKCGGCRCGKCALGSGTFTLKEEREMAMIEEGLIYDAQNKYFTIRYPWKKDPRHLPNNYIAARSRLNATQKRLLKHSLEHFKSYEGQIKDMIERGVACKLTTDELNNYEGPVQYIPHHEIIKPESKSTPIRIVFDSSASYMGHTLNEYWAKGPSIINDLLGVLLRFRKNTYGLIADISKMYNTVRLSRLDQHTHRFLWKDVDSKREPEHYALLRVPFGDRPSGTIAILALRKTAELGRIDHPKEASMILKNSYVDDLLISVNTVKEGLEVASNIDEILSQGGFSVKGWSITGTDKSKQQINANADVHLQQLRIVDSTEEKVLGMVLDVKEDSFRYIVKINFSPRIKGVRSGNNLTRDNVLCNIPENLTRRMVLSQVAGIYDPMGFLNPFTLKPKLFMRQLTIDVNKGDAMSGVQKWDTPLPEDERKKFSQLFSQLFDLELLSFPRCLKPSDSIGNPVLLIFSDASNIAYGAAAYIRWQTSRLNVYKSYLICSKNRIAPSKQITIPRLELCGAVLSSRLREKIVNEMDFHFERVMHITDSTIVHHQIQKESYGFASFVATRIGEIQGKTNPSEWWWTNSENNPADMVTRVSSIDSLGEGSIWQNGPSFLEQPIENWPISKESVIQVKELPDRIGVTMSAQCKVDTESVKDVNLEDIKLDKFNDVHKLYRTTAIVMQVLKRKKFKGVYPSISIENVNDAEKMWFRDTQRSIPKDWIKRFQRLGPDITDEGIIVVGKRMENWLMHNWGQQLLTLLPPKEPFTNLYLLSMHNEKHESVETTLTKSRMKVWVPGARRIIKTIRGKCVSCRKKDKITIGQEMGRLPIERLQPSPPFYHCAVDLFGPFKIRDSVKKRSRGKSYGVLFNCLSSRSVYIDLASGYDTDSFLIVLRRFVSIRGYPKSMRSDVGTQLVAASKELKEITQGWDWSKIYSVGEKQGMEWKTIASADAPWENGCSESLIKLAKRNIHHSVGSHILTFPELQTALFEISNLLNERPIGTTTNDPNEGSYCCPNDLLLGRASIRVPPGAWDTEDNPKRRWEFVQMIANTFWKKWMRDHFNTLIIRNKWHVSRRNLQKDDIVMVQDSNAIRGDWKLAQIYEANPGSDGKVRDVILRYKVQDSGAEYRGTLDTLIKRSAHRLVVLLPVEEQTSNSDSN